MQNTVFTPQSNNDEKDKVATSLANISRNILIVSLGLVPIFFIPSISAPLNFTKTLFVLSAILISLIFYSLAALRLGKISVKVSSGLWSAWALALVIFAAATFSGDVRDSIFGDAFGIHTAIFVCILALVIWTITIIADNKSGIMKLYALLAGSGLVIGVYQILRLLFGPDTLTFSVFNGLTSTPLGGWNDLAIFSGLSLLLAMVAVEQFPLTKWGRSLFGVVSVVSLIILAVVNFFAIWIVLGFISLIVLMYTLSKNRFKEVSLPLETEESPGSIASIILSVAVFIVSALFIIGGSGLGQLVSNATGISYVEVRPSLEATIDITRGVYQENAFVGIGPNKFVDAWRLYKDPSINQTMFWNSPFDSGVGYIPTFVVTSGIFGALAWLIFLGFIIRTGFKVLFASNHIDRFWYFVGTSSFVSALYLWGMSVIYVPGPAILILAAVFTGILYTAHSEIFPQRVLSFSLSGDRRFGFALVAMSMIVIIGSVSVLYFAGRHYSSLVSFNKAVASVQVGVPIESVEQKIADAFELSSNDLFAREIVGLQLSKMNSLVLITEPTEVQQKQFQDITIQAVNAGQLAVSSDPTDPLNWQSLANIYSLLTIVGIEGAYERSVEAFNKASELDPTNPEIKLRYAQLESRVGNLDAAKEKALEAIGLKQNYTDAFFFISQVDIARGDVKGAIDSTRASITLEPSNSARYYQLGILYSSESNMAAAAQAFENAVALNSDYANARYFLAFAYDALGRSADAQAQLEKVFELNPGNADVQLLIDRLKSGESLGTLPDVPEQVSEVEPGVGEDGEVTGNEDTDSPLLAPVNTVPGDDSIAETLERNEIQSE